MNPLQHIQLHEQEFTKSEMIIMKYVVAHLDVISSYPIATVAEKCKVSKSALLRFCQKCGYEGYSEFKYEISRYLQSVIQVDTDDKDTTSRLLNLYSQQIQELNKTVSDQKFNELADIIIHSNKIKIYGIHETGLSAQYLAYRLATLGIDSEPVNDSGNLAEKASFSKEGDLNLFLSLSGNTTVILDGLAYGMEHHAQNVLFTQNDHHKYRNKLDMTIILPTFDYEKKQIFLDSQALMFITIDLFINHLAKRFHDYKNQKV